MTPSIKRRVIAANEFSPGQLGGAGTALSWLLHKVSSSSLSQAEFSESIRNKWFLNSALDRSDPDERLKQQLKRSANVITGMRQYGLLSPGRELVSLAPFGDEVNLLLLDGREHEAAFAFSRRLLQDADGVEILRAAEAVRRREGVVRGQSVASELRLRGFDIPNNNASASKMRQWLEWSGVVDSEWRVDNGRLREIVGYGLDEVADWYSLSWTQRAFLEALHDVSAGVEASWFPTKQILAILEERSVLFDRAQARKTIYEPLARARWIELSTSTEGRHSKGGDVRQSDKSLGFNFVDVGLLKPDPLPVALQEALNVDLSIVLGDLKSEETGRKGIALEVLAARIAQDLGIVPRQLRVRGIDTGGAEVDLLAERSGFSFERWTIQCKNQTAPVSVGVVAKEAGVAAVMRSNVVLIVTTSDFTNSARSFARSVNEISATQIMLVNGVMVSDYAKRGPQAIQESLHDLAQEVGRHKSLQSRDLEAK